MNTKRILLIEDEPLIQRSLKKLLEKRGAEVTIASNGKAALDLILSTSFDRIICDLMLQDISGFDVIEDAKKKYSLSEISKIFIIITAYSSPQVLDKAQNYGCTVLSKPFTDIEQALETFMNF
ncbi:MAG: response regulator [Bacteriovoracaceae bacterium]|jgi:CheY-like chemotaxis protein|nr:response regulator [Bacteriovoracaceae bacterium]